MELKDLTYYEVSRLYPRLESIDVRVEDCYSWDETRLREFSILPQHNTAFFLECRMSKCIGDSGLSFQNVISEMYNRGETHRKVRLQCNGFNGYNRAARCEWFAVLDISLRYRTGGTSPQHGAR